MNAEQTTKTVLRLQMYAESLKQRLTSEPSPDKREFLERDLKKTQFKITRIRG